MKTSEIKTGERYRAQEYRHADSSIVRVEAAPVPRETWRDAKKVRNAALVTVLMEGRDRYWGFGKTPPEDRAWWDRNGVGALYPQRSALRLVLLRHIQEPWDDTKDAARQQHEVNELERKKAEALVTERLRKRNITVNGSSRGYCAISYKDLANLLDCIEALSEFPMKRE